MEVSQHSVEFSTMKFYHKISFVLVLVFCHLLSFGQSFLTFEKVKGGFCLSRPNQKITILVSDSDHSGILRVAEYLKKDLEAVTQNKVEIVNAVTDNMETVIIVGSLDQSPLLTSLIEKGKIKPENIQGKWEKFIIQQVRDPFSGIKNALVISGSDKRGTIYGMLELSRQAGVSPWYYWADVPVENHEIIYVKPGTHTLGEPDVKYRGIFINDEAPALRSWASETFGGFNHQFYEKVFELILRNRGNYLWPAMWRPSAFADDDPENARLANELGIVMSTSHHEPMMRAHDEWSRYGEGPWNYESNKEQLQEFWRGGIERMGDHESVVTVGMRGDGDEAMTEGTAVDLMKKIISDQRKIISEVTQKPATETPQVWALYKEVQDYYDKGLRVDDDILVLLCDDNWGNIRILPKPEDLDHEGGYGIYYHFDFVGGPVSYRWLNVTQIERVWEQMNLAYEWGVKDLWIVNVGDIKPMELPISFFLDFAWDTDKAADDLPDYYNNWAAQQFGKENAKEIGEIISLSTKYSARRTPEMLKPDTYSLENYREADRVLEEYANLLKRSEVAYSQLAESYKSAYYQLVHFPIEVLSNLNEMYVAVGKNQLYANQGRASANSFADQAKDNFFRDAELANYYHESLADGKWNHMMSQTHLGYTSWNNPPRNKMPEVTYIQPNAEPRLGYVVENGQSNRWSRGGLFSPSFSSFDPLNDQHYYLEVFNSGIGEIAYNLNTQDDWISLSSSGAVLKEDVKIWVSINWEKAPKGSHKGELVLKSSNQEFVIKVPIENEQIEAVGFVENDGVIAIEASNFSKKQDTKEIHWTVIPNMGKTGNAITVEPANAARQQPGKKTPWLAYDFTLLDSADLNVESYLSPTLNYQKSEGLKYAISIDDQKPLIVNMHQGETQPDWEYPDWWNTSVTDRIKKGKSNHGIIPPGKHTLKVWMVDPGVVFQRFVLDLGGLKPSYLGPPESKYFSPN